MLSTREAEKLSAKQQEFNKEFNKVRFKDLFLTLQFFALIISVILYITAFIKPNLAWISKFALAGTLIIMAYNNKTYVKRKNMTLIYLILSAFFIIDGIIGLVQ